MKLTNKSLYLQARDAILNIIDNSTEFMAKLPSEQELSERLGVSRNTIREALKSLENEGFIAPRHGVGTFIIRDSKNIKSNIAVLDSFTKIITNHGYTPGTKSLHHDKRIVPKDLAHKLNIDESSNVLYIDRVRTADGNPVIYVEDYITYIDNMLEKFNCSKTESIFEFLKSFDIKISFSSCNIYAVISNEKLQEKLSLKEPKALLHLEQIHYSTKGIPVMYSDSYFLSNKFDFNLVRKVID
ncbi:GntR family transcriptional regulator [Tissierella sp.]|uniref:GntR family transcriptional regulator n=1 Tax=Tissierella sp. TaxID=41274 RepID=UPI0028A8E799|nr:GntR family transcriptional regulator [Tissierella sp.]